MADDLRRDATVFAACFGRFGLATCFGASTVMLGSGLLESAGVCDAAGPHSKTVDKTATAEGATKLDDNLMTCPPKCGTEMSPHKCTVPYIPNWAIERRKHTC
jgi:hypothetical protein